MSTSTQLAMTQQNLDGAWREALFASGLQPSDAPTDPEGRAVILAADAIAAESEA